MIDPECPIIDFYPEDFKIDLNGKKYAWQGVALLPFVDEVRLKRALQSVYPLITAEEKRRNERGDDRMYVRENHKGFNLLRAIYTDDFEKDTEIQIDGQLFGGMRGRILFSTENLETGAEMDSPVTRLKPVTDNRLDRTLEELELMEIEVGAYQSQARKALEVIEKSSFSGLCA